jgi:ring-1,2-phenylacetyl-CoA epoxidase subunit PaaE
MAGFHPLPVVARRQLTEDSVTITLGVPDELRQAYRFRPGQHLTFRHAGPAGEVRRTFSICSTPASGELTVAVKLLPDGVFSAYVRDELAVDTVLDVLTPVGRFGEQDPTRTAGPHTCVAVVAGSGITPLMSIMASRLGSEPGCRFVLLYGNRTPASVMFAEEIADLKDRFPERLQVFHVISSDPGRTMITGRIDRPKLMTLLRLHPPVSVAEWYLCGPLALVELTEKVLLDADVDRGRMHRELFFTGPPALVRHSRTDLATSVITARLDGRVSTVSMPDHGSILDAVLAVRPDAPFACRGGVCGTCRMRVVAGEVRMAQNYALEPADLEAGFRLACQSVPLTPQVDIDFDA